MYLYTWLGSIAGYCLYAQYQALEGRTGIATGRDTEAGLANISGETAETGHQLMKEDVSAKTTVSDAVTETVQTTLSVITTEQQPEVITVQARTSSLRTIDITTETRDESNIMREMLESEGTKETGNSPGKHTPVKQETSFDMNGDDTEEEEESWEDFGWEAEASTQVTIPPSLLDDIGGDWDDFQNEWENGWE